MSSQCRIPLAVAMGAVVLALVMSACGAAPNSPPQPARAPLPVPTVAPGSLARVTRGSITYAIVARGRLMSAREVALSFPMDGMLRTLPIQLGAPVKEGDVIAELDAWDLEMSVLAAQAEVDLTQARLAQAKLVQAQQIATCKADLDVAIAQDAASALERDRMDQQIREGKVPHGRVEEQLIQDLTAKAELDRARLEQARVRYNAAFINTDQPVISETLRVAQTRLERLQARLEQTRLRAPFSGTIVALDAQAGDNVQGHQKIGVLADPSRPILAANVFEEDIPRVSVGLAATVKFDGYPTRTFVGKVSQVGVQPIPSQGKNAYQVTVTFDDPAGVPAGVRQGAEVSIAAQTRSDLLLVPARAVIREGIQSYAQVVREGSVVRVPIQLGVSDGTRSEVLAGLQEGDTVKVP
jgi:HlyD family secretion protein